MTAKPMPGAAVPAKIFSHYVSVEDIPEAGLDVAIAADAATLQALAAADKLPGIGRLEADFHVAPRPGRRFNVSGEMRANITQICGVSLEPFDSDIVEPVNVDFSLPANVKAARGAGSRASPDSLAVVVGPDDPDPPETIVGGKIDLQCARRPAGPRSRHRNRTQASTANRSIRRARPVPLFRSRRLIHSLRFYRTNSYRRLSSY